MRYKESGPHNRVVGDAKPCWQETTNTLLFIPIVLLHFLSESQRQPFKVLTLMYHHRHIIEIQILTQNE